MLGQQRPCRELGTLLPSSPPSLSTDPCMQALHPRRIPIRPPTHPPHPPPQVAGYAVHYQGLVYATIKGAGHMVPEDKPLQALVMLDRFLQQRQL